MPQIIHVTDLRFVPDHFNWTSHCSIPEYWSLSFSVQGEQHTNIPELIESGWSPSITGSSPAECLDLLKREYPTARITGPRWIREQCNAAR